ncbi:MAG: MFS transporter [Janthinobacterium lividum]
MTYESQKTLWQKIPASVWGIGFATLFVNLSSIVIISLWPIYMTEVYGLATLKLGVLEGFVEFSSWFTRIFAGVISDYLRKRKPLLLIAYVLMTFSRLIFAFAPNLFWIYGGRLTDRIANGLQATPREALIGDVAPPELKGTCYGLRQTLSVAGSLVGAMATIYIMPLIHNDYQLMFLLTAIPAVLSIIIIGFFVKDKASVEILSKKSFTGTESLILPKKSIWYQLQNTKKLKKPFWLVVMVTAIFMVANYSVTFSILQAKKVGFETANIPMILILQNLFTMFSAFPMGYLADKIDRRYLLAIGFLITIVSNLFYGFATTTMFILIGAALWGIQIGITQSLLLTKIADTTSDDLRGTGFGIFYLCNGIALFLSNSLTGWLFQEQGPFWAFMCSNVMVALALVLLPLLKPIQK